MGGPFSTDQGAKICSPFVMCIQTACAGMGNRGGVDSDDFCEQDNAQRCVDQFVDDGCDFDNGEEWVKSFQAKTGVNCMPYESCAEQACVAEKDHGATDCDEPTGCMDMDQCLKPQRQLDEKG